MPTASTAKKVTTPRKRRTRKASTPKTTDKVIKEIQAVLDAPTPKSLDKVQPSINTPVAKSIVTEVKVEKKVRPTKTNLTYVDYIEDAKVRWSIHSYETSELWADVVKLYNKSVPVVVSAIDYVKVSYNKAFNDQNKDT